jgi:hypothetical protein
MEYQDVIEVRGQLRALGYKYVTTGSRAYGLNVPETSDYDIVVYDPACSFLRNFPGAVGFLGFRGSGDDRPGPNDLNLYVKTRSGETINFIVKPGKVEYDSWVFATETMIQAAARPEFRRAIQDKKLRIEVFRDLRMAYRSIVERE